MADNVTIDPGETPSVGIAADEVTYSSDSAKVQLMRPVLVTGSEGSKTVVELTGDNTFGLDVDVTRSALPSGAATSAKQDTGNASLSSIDGKLTACNTGAVVVSASALPSGAATAAKQPALGAAGVASADVISVQGIASMTPLRVDGSGVTQPVSGTVAVSGEVDVTPASPSASSYLPVRLSDGTSFYSAGGGGGGGDGAITDGVSSSIKATVLDYTNSNPLAVRLTDTSGDAIAALPVTDNGGSLTVDGSVSITGSVTVASHAVTNIGTFAVQESGSALTSLQLIDDVVLAEDAASASGDKGVMALAVRSSSPANTSGTNGDYEPLQVNAGRLWASATIDAALPAGSNAIGKLAANDGIDIGDVTINNPSLPVTQSGTWNVGTVSTITNVVHVDDNSGSLTVDGSVSVTGTVTVDSELTTADLDTGAGTDTRAVVGMVLAASGGGVLVGTANPMPVSDNGGSLTVDGTVTANAGTGTFAVSAASLPLPSGAATSAKQDTGNTSLSSIDGKITACNTGAVVVSSSALPSGAATAAKQPALGTAGTPSADVITVQGTTSMVALKVDGSAITQPVSGSVSIGSALPAGSNAIGKLAANDGVDVGDVTINNASGASAVNIQDGGNSITVDNGGTIAVQSSQSGTWTVQPGNTANTTAWLVTDTPGTSGGWSKAKYLAQTTTVQTTKGSAGKFGGYYYFNPNSSVAYIQVFDTTGAVTLGTTAPDMSYGVPAGSAANIEIGKGVDMVNGIKLACTTTAAGNTAPSTGLDLVIYYK